MSTVTVAPAPPAPVASPPGLTVRQWLASASNSTVALVAVATLLLAVLTGAGGVYANQMATNAAQAQQQQDRAPLLDEVRRETDDHATRIAKLEAGQTAVNGRLDTIAGDVHDTQQDVKKLLLRVPERTDRLVNP